MVIFQFALLVITRGYLWTDHQGAVSGDGILNVSALLSDPPAIPGKTELKSNHYCHSCDSFVILFIYIHSSILYTTSIDFQVNPIFHYSMIFHDIPSVFIKTMTTLLVFWKLTILVALVCCQMLPGFNARASSNSSALLKRCRLWFISSMAQGADGRGSQSGGDMRWPCPTLRTTETVNINIFGKHPLDSVWFLRSIGGVHDSILWRKSVQFSNFSSDWVSTNSTEAHWGPRPHSVHRHQSRGMQLLNQRNGVAFIPLPPMDLTNAAKTRWQLPCFLPCFQREKWLCRYMSKNNISGPNIIISTGACQRPPTLLHGQGVLHREGAESHSLPGKISAKWCCTSSHHHFWISVSQGLKI